MKKVYLLFMAVMLTACASSGGERVDAAKATEIARAHTDLAASYYERTQYAIALQEIEIAMQADSDYAPAYNVRALVRMALREDDLADADFRRSLRLDEKNSEAHNNYGWFLCQRGKLQESLVQFRAALDNPLYETPEMAYLNQGLCASRAGLLKEAETSFQRALLMRPNMPEVIYGMAELNYRKGDFAAAKAYFSRYFQMGLELTAEQLWLAVRIERKVRDRVAEASYALQLRKRYPDSREAQLLLQGK
jgi:type IV pilus assembly protein PilF